jgi:type IV pilus assembly protein PilX
MALVFVLIMMSIIFVIAAVTSRIATMGERASRNDRDRQIAFQAAEAALSDAELDIMGPASAGATRVSMFWDTPTDDTCSTDFANNTRGLCPPLAPQSGDADLRQMYLRILNNADTSTRSWVEFGDYTNRTGDFAVASSSNTGALPSQLPRYIVEKTSVSFRNRSAAAGQPKNAFLVTAIGYGLQPTTQVLLQALISKPVPTN